jgi:hypothetical protein
MQTGQTVLMIDWAGSGDGGFRDIANTAVVAAVRYNTTSSASYIDGCEESVESAEGAPGQASTVKAISVLLRDQLGTFFAGLHGWQPQ